ncbi:MAG TPA: hypothetical protein VNH41_11040 [Steroidobacteraceae bacterium]|nr:hypothetical protein [Steroidobacteraceae bacterium]
MRQPGYVIGLVVVLSVAGCAHVPRPPETRTAPAISPATALPGVSAADRQFRSAAEDPKDGPCISTTHGCIALNSDVDEETIDNTICISGYTKSVRPATSYTNGVKKKLMHDAGIDAARIGDYELDHIVPLDLGGHPRKLSNLMLQPWEGQHGAKAKDALEVRLKSLVCHGKLDLTDAQVCIARDWEACALQYPRR